MNDRSHQPECYLKGADWDEYQGVSGHSDWRHVSAEELNKIREYALRAQKKPSAMCEQAKNAAFAWVRFLLEGSKDTYYLQHHRIQDDVFYQLPEKAIRHQSRGDVVLRNLQPKSFEQGEQCEHWPEKWQNKLKWPWLKPERLTVPELELALAIFDWKEKDPRFVWWIHEYPHILRRIHAFLLHHYASTMLRAFRKALRHKEKATCDRPVPGGERLYTLNRPPFRAGAFWSWYPAEWALCLIGMLAILNINVVQATLFASTWGIAVPLGVVALAALFWIIWIDVFKQNHGWLMGGAHAFRRVAIETWRFAWRGCTVSALVVMTILIVQCIGWQEDLLYSPMPDVDPREEIVVPALPAEPDEWTLLLIGVLAQGLLAAVIGALLQWFWQDRAATDPV